MELKPINRICPRCGNGNYMRIIDGKNVGKLNVKCINCNSYYNYDELLKKDNSKPLNGAGGRTMDDLIPRAAAIAAFDDERVERNYGDVSPESVIRVIESIPAVDAEPVVHGRWVKMTGMMPPEYHGHYECSECQWHMKGLRSSWTREEEMLYCPNCGSRMDLEE